MIEAPNIVVVEDDDFQSGHAVEALGSVIPQARVRVIETEHEFRTRFPELVGNPPDLVIMDIVLRWGKLSADISEQPEGAAIERFFTAGLRLQELLHRNPSTENTTVLLWSYLDLEDLNKMRFPSDTLEGAYFLKKSPEFRCVVAEEAKLILEGKTPLHAVRLEAFDFSATPATLQG